MKKSIMILMLVIAGFFCSGQNSTDSAYRGTSDSVYGGPSDSVYVGNQDSVKAEVVIARETNALTKAGLAKAIETGTIYNSASPYHNVSHEFTSLVAMRDYCDKTLSQMRANGEVNKKLSKKLKRELSKAKAELASAKYKGLKVESDYYELFLKQIREGFKE